MKSMTQREQEKKALLSSQTIYEGKVLRVKQDTYQLHDRTRVFDIIEHAGAVVIVPITAEGKIILVQQWRRAADEITIELPAGTLEEGEDPLDCAKRELQEEISHAAKKWTPLGGFFSAPGYCTEYLHLFAAEDLHPSALEPDDDEMIDTLTVSVGEVKHMVEQNRIRDTKTVAGILKYLLCAKK
jgi:ADP-ribose pyrophosphatase